MTDLPPDVAEDIKRRFRVDFLQEYERRRQAGPPQFVLEERVALLRFFRLPWKLTYGSTEAQNAEQPTVNPRLIQTTDTGLLPARRKREEHE